MSTEKTSRFACGRFGGKQAKVRPGKPKVNSDFSTVVARRVKRAVVGMEWNQAA
jgi:hypothetical protein